MICGPQRDWNRINARKYIISFTINIKEIEQQYITVCTNYEEFDIMKFEMIGQLDSAI